MRFAFCIIFRNLKKNFAAIRNFILDTLFPVSCLSCGRYGVFLCDICLGKIKILPEQVCPYCETNITQSGKICLSCKIKLLAKKSAFLDGLLVCARYEFIAHPAHVYKYNFIEKLAIPLSKLMLRASLEHELKLPDFIAPVPLHSRRERWRGFNQSKLLAIHLSRNLSPGFIIPALDLVERKKFTAPQMEIKSHREREKNILSAFTINHVYKNKLAGKKILLIDDICTTGSTLFECAKVLKSAGVSSVWGMVLARQEFKN